MNDGVRSEVIFSNEYGVVTICSEIRHQILIHIYINEEVELN